MRLQVVAAACCLLWRLVGADSNLTNTKSLHLILSGDFKPPQVFENTNVVRNTNLEKSYVRETVNLVVTNIDKSPQSDYYLPFDYDVAGKVGGIEVRDKKNADKGKFEVITAAFAGSLDDNTTK
jgi:oligosaccharyltransferase complex subunit alpha (ribophorin I)